MCLTTFLKKDLFQFSLICKGAQESEKPSQALDRVGEEAGLGRLDSVAHEPSYCDQIVRPSSTSFSISKKETHLITSPSYWGEERKKQST